MKVSKKNTEKLLVLSIGFLIGVVSYKFLVKREGYTPNSYQDSYGSVVNEKKRKG